MSKLSLKARGILLALVAALSIGGLAFLLPSVFRAAYAEEGGIAALQAESPDRAADGQLTVLAFSSDVHSQSDKVAANRTGTWLELMADENHYGHVDAMAFGGDLGSASAGSASNFFTYAGNVIDAVDGTRVPGVFTTGNHEFNPGDGSLNSNGTSISSNANPEVASRYVLNTVGREGDNYIIYCLGSESWSSTYANQVSSLRSFLADADSDKPIFIITHFPLHYAASRSTTSASDVIDVLNDAAATGKKIVYIWGHNHTNAPNDTYYDEVFTPGYSLEYSSGSKKTIQFYYAAAGCMSDSEYASYGSTGSKYVLGKGLVVTVNSKDQLSFAYYTEAGVQVVDDHSTGGYSTFTEQDPVAIEGVSISENGTSPTVEAGKRITLHASVTPADATVKTKTWTSSDTSVATVDTNGIVKGVSEGKATITVTISDGINRNTVSASVEVTVTPRTSSGPVYVQTDTLVPGKNYIIANLADGDAYALTNNSGSIGATQVTVDAGTITLDEENESIVFTAVGSSSVTDFENNGHYLAIGSSGGYYSSYSPTLESSARSIAWTYSNSLLSTHRSSSSSTNYYWYYSSSNGWSVSNTTSGTSPREVYLFQEVEEQVPVTGVTVTPQTAEVEVRRSVQLTATVEPANATIKSVTWTSSDTSIATVDENGRVRGVAEGTATITAITVDGGKRATATVHVNPSTSTETHYVIVIDGYALSTDISPNTAQGGSDSYTYTGLAGVAYDGSAVVPDNIRWIVEPTDGGYYIKSLDGQYLNATYTSGTNSGHGDLKLDGTPDVWVLDDGHSFEDGEINGSYLKSTNATNSTPDKPKYLGYEDSANLFTVRSKDNADTITVVEAEDPIAVTGISVDPTEATVQARMSVQLTATVLPENATNKNVTWTSSDPSVATVDESGSVRGVAEGTATITVASAADPTKTATCAVTVTPNDNPQQTYVIVIDGFALSTDRSPNSANGGSESYVYTGLAGVAYDGSAAAPDNIRWIVEPTDGGYHIRSLDGKYLNATYVSGSSSGQGDLKLDTTPDVWVLDDGLTIDDLVIDGSLLKSTNATATASSEKYLAYEESANLFTVRSEGNADEATIIDPDNPVVTATRFVETTGFVDGGEYIIAVNANSDGTSVYAIENVGGSSSADTGSETLEVTPVSGGKDYIVTSNTGVVWNYNSNNYLENNTRYLSRGGSSGAYVPRASGSGSAVTYDAANQRLSISYGSSWGGSSTTYYLTNSNGTFGLSTSASSAAQVRLFHKETSVLYTVKWVDGDGNVLQTDQLEKGAMPAYSGDTPTKAEDDQYTYTFKGWSPEPAAVTGNATYTAQFEAVPKTSTSYTVTFNTNGGSTIAAQTVEAGGKANAPDPAPTKECSTFGGWYSDEGLTTAFDFNTAITANTTLYAKWSDAHTLTATPAKAATCTEEGNSAYWTCSVCHKYFSDEAGATAIAEGSWVIAALGHDLVHHEAKAATCTEVGWGAYDTCSRCDYTTYAEIAATGHDWEFTGFTWTGSDAEGYTSAVANYTCKNDGAHKDTAEAAIAKTSTDATCTVAGTVTYTATVSADASLDDAAHEDVKNVSGQPLGHDFGEWAQTTAPTCTAKGEEARSCSRCGATETREVAALGHDLVHHDAKAATCTEAGWDAYDTCSRCDYTTYAEIAALGHDFGEWTQTTAPTCTAKGEETRSCTRCGATETREVAALGHDYVAVVTAPTCTAAGYTTYTCSRCGDSYIADEVPALGHDLVHHDAKAATCTEAGWETYDTCSRCDYTTYVAVDAIGHAFGDPAYAWAVDNSSVTATRACTRCDRVETETAEAAGEVTTPATCTAEGVKTWTSAAFENEAFAVQTTTEVVPATGHNFGEWAQTTAPTCTAKGEEARSCSRCGATETREVAALGHTPAADPAVAPTCTATGLTEGSHCSVCDEVLVAQEVVPALGHDLVHHDAKAATCTEAGWEAYDTCSRCDYTTYAEIAATGHTPADAVQEKVVAATCTAAGSYDEVVYCSICNAELSRTTKTTEALGHAWDEGVITTAPGCEIEGVKTFTCTRCQATRTEAVPAAGHTWGEGVVTTEPGCETEGVKTFTCSVCGKTTTEAIDPLGHDWNIPTYTWNKDEDGNYTGVTATRTCKRDATHIETETADIDESKTVVVEPTETEEGSITYTCKEFVNPAFKSRDLIVVIPATGHELDYDNIEWAWTGNDEEGYTAAKAIVKCVHFDEDGYKIVVDATVTSETTAATCAEAGKTVYTATVSFEGEAYTDSKTVVIPALGHTPADAVKENVVAATCTVAGSYDEVVYCSVCGAEISRKTVETPAPGHDYVAVVTAPTCTAAGFTTYTCSRCGDTYTADEVPALGHTPADAVKENVVAATCTVAGSYDEVVYCSVCGAEISRKSVETPALGHSFGDPTYVWTADNSSVTATRTCSVCSFEETETVAVTSKVDDDGNTILTAEFENPAFEIQTKVIEADKIDISPADVTADKTPMGLFTAPASPTPKVVLDGVELVLGKDFEIVGYGNNKYPGAATVTVRGIGDYTGEATGAFIVDEPFCDVDESTYHHDDILWMYGMGITKGWGEYPNCEYRPLDPIARADMAAFLYRLAGKPAFVPSGSFSDVPAGLDHYDEIMWLASSGISTGFPDGTFRPYAYIVRCDMAAFLYRLAGKPAFVPGSSPFNDVTPATDHFDEIRWLSSTGVSGGFPDGGYHPYGNVTRCDMAAFLHRMDEKGLVDEW